MTEKAETLPGVRAAAAPAAARARVPVMVLSGFGINAEIELADAFRRAGASADIVHIGDLAAQPRLLEDYRIVGFPGGFSFGDHLGSGKVLASLVRAELRTALQQLVRRGGLVIGICNGFQILAKSGMLPDLDGDWTPCVSLIHNDCGRFENSWTECQIYSAASEAWLRGLGRIELPVRHGEGRFVCADSGVLRQLQSNGRVALRYRGRNPNGSQDGIAGICDPSGRVLGLMPHPEAFCDRLQHPKWTRGSDSEPTGLAILRNGVQFAAVL